MVRESRLCGAVVGYCRYSSSNQREESISAQKRFILGYAQSNGLNVETWYVDEAFSGKTDKRPAFLEMIEAAKAGRSIRRAKPEGRAFGL